MAAASGDDNYSFGDLLNLVNGGEINLTVSPVLVSGIILGEGGGGNINPWELRGTLVTLLRGKNPCSDWFNQGKGSAADIMSNVPILRYDPKEVSYNMPDGNTGSYPETPISVNNLGRFYTDRYNSVPVDPYAAGSFGAQMTILLHELGHKVQPPGFISDDASKAGDSDKNTQTVASHCAKTIDAAQKP